MVMNIWNQFKNASGLDTEQDTVMGSFAKDSKELHVTEKPSFCKAPNFFFCKASTFVLVPLISWEKSLADLFLFGLKGCLWTRSQYQELIKNKTVELQITLLWKISLQCIWTKLNSSTQWIQLLGEESLITTALFSGTPLHVNTHPTFSYKHFSWVSICPMILNVPFFDYRLLYHWFEITFLVESTAKVLK